MVVKVVDVTTAIVVVVVPSSHADSNIHLIDVSPTSRSPSPTQVFPVG